MLNPSVRQEPRYEPAAVIPLKKDASIIEWLQKHKRLIARDKEEAEVVLEEDVELSELMDVDDIGYDDDDDEELVLDED
ncbi:MAG: hypothetical protein N5P05_003316 [Chroococcopsis gigantea SAG 12.99]|jgi:hypothetical protein|nr:DUF3134 domain-containing protein [Chlorogloea purpurea SAG 13.99]MDV3001710.1 hypothetical protein [Chroococcopsis gigantea SAG 12.99]